DGTAFAVKYSFVAGTGSIPIGSFVLANNGKLYGTAREGGFNNNGVIFSFDPIDSVYTDVFDFNGANGEWPHDELLIASNGLFYGTAEYGGANNYGVLFSFDPLNNTFTKLLDFNFSNGTTPIGSLIQAINGMLYGVTLEGGLYDLGVIFSFNLSNNTYTDIFDFDGPLGNNPMGGLIQLSTNNKLYGMTDGGGNGGHGVLYSFDITNSTYTVEINFNGTNGDGSSGRLLEATNGLLYGTTYYGGINGDGNLISFDPQNGMFTNLFNFNGINGFEPNSNLIQASDGKLYGTTQEGGVNGDGVIFRFNPTNNSYNKIFDFNGTNGSIPNGTLVELVVTAIVENNFSKNKLNIFPNPATGPIQLTFNTKEKINLQLEIVNVMGEKVYQTELQTLN
ncbi:MAG: choice-of-anchor tandem repeat GloVer-containing protein, partial [Bacteroidota bacterium]